MTLTLEAKIKSHSSDQALRLLNTHLSTTGRKLWSSLYVKHNDLAQVKKQALGEFGISGRHFNSLRVTLDGKAASILEINKMRISDLDEAIKATVAKIKSLNNGIKSIAATLKTIDSYITKVKAWRSNKQGKKPKQPANIQGQHQEALRDELKKKKQIHHQKQRRLRNLKQKQETLKLGKATPALVFGGSKLFKAQFKLDENGYADHQEWLEAWRFFRNNQSFWLGSHEESAHNQNAQYDPIKGTLRLRMPYTLEDELGKYLVIEDLFFLTKQDRKINAPNNPELLRAFFEPKNVGGKERFCPFSYRIMERSEGKFYVQVSFEPHPNPVVTSKFHGAIGIDLNADHLACVEVDEAGNPVQAGSYYFDFRDKSTDQREAIFGDYIAEICDAAKAVNKSIVVEDLDFRKKKAGLREKGGHRYAQMLSSFAYNKFYEMLQSRAARMDVGIHRVNPAYTSVIGFAKYYGYYKLTSHQKAALIIARRAMGLSERPKVLGTREETVSILGEDDTTAFEKTRRPRHVWSFWAYHSKALREKLRASTKEVPEPTLISPLRPSGFKAAYEKRAANRKASAKAKARSRGSTVDSRQCSESFSASQAAGLVPNLSSIFG